MEKSLGWFKNRFWMEFKLLINLNWKKNDNCSWINIFILISVIINNDWDSCLFNVFYLFNCGNNLLLICKDKTL